MLVNFFKSIFGSRNDRIINGYTSDLTAINKTEKDLINLSDNELKNKSSTLKDLIKKNQISQSESRILAFAICREASKRAEYAQVIEQDFNANDDSLSNFELDLQTLELDDTDEEEDLSFSDHD